MVVNRSRTRPRPRAAASPPRAIRWSAKAKRLALYIGLAVTTLTLIVLIPNASKILRPLMPTWVAWVEEHTTSELEPIKARQLQASIAIDRLIVVQLKAQLDAAEKDDQARHPLAQERIQELRNDLKAAQARIDAAKTLGGRAAAGVP